MPSFTPDTAFAAALASRQSTATVKPSARHFEWAKHMHAQRQSSTASELYVTPVKDADLRVPPSGVPPEMRVMMAVTRTMERNPPREGSSGFRGSIDDASSAPSSYEWLKAALEGMASKWESTSTVGARCIFCNNRFAPNELKDHIKGMHGSFWQGAMVEYPRTRKFRVPMMGQDLIGMWLYVGCRMETYNKPMTAAQDKAFNELLACYGHIGFVVPGDDFSIIGRFTALDEMCAIWFQSCV